MLFEINVNKLIITPSVNRLLVSDSVGFWQAKINLDSDWDGLNCKIVFYTDSVAKDVLIPNDGIVEVPHEVLNPDSKLRFTISGYSEDKTKVLHTKEMLGAITVYSAGKYMGDNPEAYTPELWEQVMAKLNNSGGGEDDFLSYIDAEYNPESENAQSGIALSSVFANALNEKVTGKSITVDDVSPIKTLAKLSVNGVEDLTKVNVCCYSSKNVLKIKEATAEFPKTQVGLTFENNSGSIKITGTKQSGTLKIPCKATLLKGFDYRFSINLKDNGGLTNRPFFYFSTDSNPTSTDDYYFSTTDNLYHNNTIVTVVTPEDNVVINYIILQSSTTVGEVYDIEIKPQIEIGNKITDFEEGMSDYQISTYTDGNGAVNGIYTLPKMVIASNNGDATITLEYNKDINKPTADLNYDPESSNPQSGIAVDEALLQLRMGCISELSDKSKWQQGYFTSAVFENLDYTTKYTNDSKRICMSECQKVKKGTILDIVCHGQYYRLAIMTKNGDGTYSTHSTTSIWSDVDQSIEFDGEYYIIFSVATASSLADSVDITPDMLTMEIRLYEKGVIRDFENSIKELNGLRGTDKNIPIYFKTHIENKINTIRQKNILSGVNGDSFIFLTDPHTPTNSGNSIQIAKAISRATNNTMLICGGDILTLNHTETEAIDYFHKFIDEVKANYGKDFRFCYGNHEFAFTPYKSEDIYSICLKPFESEVVNQAEGSPKAYSYYWDNTVQNIRYFVLDSGWNNQISLDTLKWLAETVLITPEEYSIGIFTHAIFGVSADNAISWLANTDILVSIINAINTKNKVTVDNMEYDYSDTSAEIMFVLCGHAHLDFAVEKENEYSDANGVTLSPTAPIIVTLNDGWRSASVTGTIKELAFDVVDIDKNNRKIYLTRIGDGADREFDY